MTRPLQSGFSGFLFDTNALLEIPKRDTFASQGARSPLQSFIYRVQARGWRCAVPAHILAEYLRNQSATAYSTTQSGREAARRTGWSARH